MITKQYLKELHEMVQEYEQTIGNAIDKNLTEDEQKAIIGPIDISNQMLLCEAICGAYQRLVTETIERMSQLRGQNAIKTTLRKTLYAAQKKIEEVIKHGGSQ